MRQPFLAPGQEQPEPGGASLGKLRELGQSSGEKVSMDYKITHNRSTHRVQHKPSPHPIALPVEIAFNIQMWDVFIDLLAAASFMGMSVLWDQGLFFIDSLSMAEEC